MRVIARATGMTAVFGEAARKRWRTYGNVLLARGPITDVEVIRLPRPGQGEQRVAIVAGVTVDGLTLSVGATHLSFRRGEGSPQLQVLLDALGRRDGPRVLLGDLNLGPEVVEPAVTAAGYALAPTGPTFPTSGPRTRIDFVAVSGFEILAASTPEAGISDHLPVVADVRAEETAEQSGRTSRRPDCSAVSSRWSLPPGVRRGRPGPGRSGTGSCPPGTRRSRPPRHRRGPAPG